MRGFYNELGKHMQLTKSVKRALEKVATVEVFEKREMIVSAGAVCTKMYFIEKGMIRSYSENQEREMTEWIYFPGDFTSCWESIFYNQKSEENLEAIAETKVIAIDYQDLEKLFVEYPQLEHWWRKLMEGYALDYKRFSQYMRFATASEKYEFYRNNFPETTGVKLGYIASFLGMTQETLSRLRKQVNLI